MLKMFVLQKFHGLSDFELDKQFYDQISFRKFLGAPEQITEGTTI
jgi:IS5 family transposase